MDAVVAVLDVVILAALFVRVGREEITQDATATPELWNRPLSWWTQHQTTEPDQAAGDGAVLPIGLSSRIAESAATSNHNARSRI